MKLTPPPVKRISKFNQFIDRIKAKVLRLPYVFNQIFSDYTHIVLVCKLLAIDRKRDEYVYKGDYILYSSIDLCAHEIKKKGVEGSVAEGGVYRGDRSKILNLAFPDRNLFLFDTFEGFNPDEQAADSVNKRLSSGSERAGLFTDTNVELVLSKLRYPEKAVICKGWFPDTTKGLEDEKFVFIWLDFDLYDPIYAGLCYFYPRLQEGGYIILDNYGDPAFKGVEEAVKRFSTENHVPYFPLTIFSGGCVFMK